MTTLIHYNIYSEHKGLLRKNKGIGIRPSLLVLIIYKVIAYDKAYVVLCVKVDCILGTGSFFCVFLSTV
mgnify:CR=1 FL=1